MYSLIDLTLNRYYIVAIRPEVTLYLRAAPVKTLTQDSIFYDPIPSTRSISTTYCKIGEPPLSNAGFQLISIEEAVEDTS